MQDNKAYDIVRLVCEYIIKHAFKLFDQESRVASLQQIVSNLRTTSKWLNNSICDELSLEIMRRWMHGRNRSRRVASKIEKMLQNNDRDVFKFMDLVSKIFSQRESARLLSNYLITITKYHRYMLKDYIDFFKSRNFHLSLREYYSHPRSFPFPGFQPEHVEKSMQIANQNSWIEECVMLLDYFEAYLFPEIIPLENLQFGVVERIRAAIKNGEKLNFSAHVANRIHNASKAARKNNDWQWIRESKFSEWFDRYLDPIQITTTNDLLVLQDVAPTEIFKVLAGGDYTRRFSRLISFRGSRLLKSYYRRGDVVRRIYKEVIPDQISVFTALPADPARTQTTYIYHFYRAIVKNDLEKAKKIQLENDINLNKLSGRPHPLNEYLRFADQYEQATVDYLVENFDGVKTCLKKIGKKKHRYRINF
jgi:hypothetical protein